jgi:phosphatidylinositol alpha 1,6-mannosyltransferase
MRTNVPRVALFTDSYYEANGVARTATALEEFAAERELPLLVVHGGRATHLVEHGSIVRLELARWQRTSFSRDHEPRFDVALWRHASRVADVLRRFRPDVLHFTGPSDIGQLGAYLGHRLHIPMVGSWHTNLHEYPPLLNRFARMRPEIRREVRWWVERRALRATMLFYAVPRVVLAPNEAWKALIEWRLAKPTFLMTRGVDTELFTPAKRTQPDSTVVNIGYVGRLSAKKNVRALAAVQDALWAAGIGDVGFTIVGDGAEREWLQARMPGARFTGVLRGERLAEAYANLDLFVLPSETDTVGNVVLEAMASGVPVITMARGGPKFSGVPLAAAALAHTEDELVELTIALARDGERRRVMGAAARADALERSWAPVFDTVYQAYDVAIALGNRDMRRSEGLVAIPIKTRQIGPQIQVRS